MKKLVAYIKCHWWCLLHVFQGHRVVIGSNARGVEFIAAASGTIKNSKIERIFFNTGNAVRLNSKNK